MSVFLFKNGNNDPTRNSFDKYYIPLVEIKDFNAIIFNKPFFLLTQKKQQEGYQMPRNVKKWWLYNRKRIRLFVPPN